MRPPRHPGEGLASKCHHGESVAEAVKITTSASSATNRGMGAEGLNEATRVNEPVLDVHVFVIAAVEAPALAQSPAPRWMAPWARALDGSRAGSATSAKARARWVPR